MPVIPPVSQVMTPFPYSVDWEQKVSEARALMVEHDVRHLPVTSSGKLVGVITDRDIGLAVGPDPIPPAQDLQIRALSVLKPYKVDLHTPLDKVLLEMADRHIGSALITKKGKLVGVFTSTDACRAFGTHLREQRPTGDHAA
jgi:acetoin utilization protein AcuB